LESCASTIRGKEVHKIIGEVREVQTDLREHLLKPLLGTVGQITTNTQLRPIGRKRKYFTRQSV